MTWALVLVATALLGCGERNARPTAEPAVVATAAPAAPPSPSAAAPAASPLPPAPTAAAAPAATTAANASFAKLSVKRLVVAKGVKGHEPVDAGTSFSAKDAG